ncbi:hypothetical protein [Azospirillum argentinense]
MTRFAFQVKRSPRGWRSPTVIPLKTTSGNGPEGRVPQSSCRPDCFRLLGSCL